MKKLVIIRHAKSDWNTGEKDFDRPLNDRGMKDAPIMGKHLKTLSIEPDAILSSTANRAKSTAFFIAKEVGFPLTEISLKDEIYHATPKAILNEIWKMDNTVNTLFIFGHNPGLSDLTSYLIEDEVELKTCCVAVLNLMVDDWSALVSGTCTLEEYLSPKVI